jgi:hypothetical protein
VRDEERRETFLQERVERPERLGRRTRLELHELRRLLEPHECVGEPVRRVAELGCAAVGLELPLRREQQVHAGCRDRSEHEEQCALEPAAYPAQLDHRCGQHDHRCLQHDVAVLHVGELVRDHALELGGRTRGQDSGAESERRVRGAAPGRECDRQAVGNEIEARLHDARPRGEPLDRRMQQRRLRDRKLPRAHHAEHDAIERPVRADDEQQRAEDEDRQKPHAVERPADEREQSAHTGQQDPRLHDVAHGDEAAHYASSESGPPPFEPSSSSSPRGGQSSFACASQRLEQ